MNILYNTLFGSPEKKPQTDQSTMNKTSTEKTVVPSASSSSSGQAPAEQVQQYDKAGNPIFDKQQMAWYKRNDTSPKQLVTVVGVHFDDFPIYYTIRPVDPSKSTFDEKQTDGNRLCLVGVDEKLQIPVKKENDDNTITILIAFNKKDSQLKIDPMLSVYQLKEEISEKTGITIKEMKLTYKGVVLKEDETSISQSQLVNGSKIQLSKNKAR
jgi:hypothetical protein